MIQPVEPKPRWEDSPQTAAYRAAFLQAHQQYTGKKAAQIDAADKAIVSIND